MRSLLALGLAALGAPVGALAAHGGPMKRGQCRTLCQRFGMKMLGPAFSAAKHPTDCMAKCEELCPGGKADSQCDKSVGSGKQSLLQVGSEIIHAGKGNKHHHGGKHAAHKPHGKHGKKEAKESAKPIKLHNGKGKRNLRGSKAGDKAKNPSAGKKFSTKK